MPEYRIYYLKATNEWCCMTEQDGGKIFGYGDTPQKALNGFIKSLKTLIQMLAEGPVEPGE